MLLQLLADMFVLGFIFVEYKPLNNVNKTVPDNVHECILFGNHQT